MTKTELVNLLTELNVPVNEGTPEDREMDVPFRICFFEYNWESNTASGKEFNTIVTYQISIISDKPRHPKLVELKHKLNDIGLFPQIIIEHNIEKRRIHAFFSLEVLENI